MMGRLNHDQALGPLRLLMSMLDLHWLIPFSTQRKPRRLSCHCRPTLRPACWNLLAQRRAAAPALG